MKKINNIVNNRKNRENVGNRKYSWEDMVKIWRSNLSTIEWVEKKEAPEEQNKGEIKCIKK